MDFTLWSTSPIRASFMSNRKTAMSRDLNLKPANGEISDPNRRQEQNLTGCAGNPPCELPHKTKNLFFWVKPVYSDPPMGVIHEGEAKIYQRTRTGKSFG